jgi:F-type H+-transporting ATPase subunit alpha
MKKVAGTLKLDQAQYRELESFSKFGSDLDQTTVAILDKGKKNVEILKQPQYSPLNTEEQIAIIFCGTNGLLSDVPENKVADFEKRFLELLSVKHRTDVLDVLKAGKIDDTVTEILKTEALNLAKSYKE